jgi:hypothetical protein
MPTQARGVEDLLPPGRVTAYAGYVPANQLDGLIELLLPPTRDENVGALFDEPLGARQRNAA